ncbi:hypothetical protein [Streptomyces parvus]|uniref:hypothetical protein n=1 Tax=Streptomyces parvus TaxID=66428 RepID=UPI0036317104
MKNLAAEQSADAASRVLSHFRVELYDCLYPVRMRLRAHRRGAVLGRTGDVAGRVGLHGRASAWARSGAWRGQPRPAEPAPLAQASGINAAAACRRRARGHGGREPPAASRRPTSPESLFCHVYGRCRGADQIIPGRPCSFVAALETGRTSWTAALDAIRGGQAREHGGVLRRFDREHTFRLFQQTLGWTVPEARASDPARN